MRGATVSPSRAMLLQLLTFYIIFFEQDQPQPRIQGVKSLRQGKV